MAAPPPNISALSRLGRMLNSTWHHSSGCWIACQSQAEEMGRERDGGGGYRKRQGKVYQPEGAARETERRTKERKGWSKKKQGSKWRVAKDVSQASLRNGKQTTFSVPFPPHHISQPMRKKRTSLPPKSGRRRTSYPFSSLSTIPFTTEIFPVDGLKDKSSKASLPSLQVAWCPSARREHVSCLASQKGQNLVHRPGNMVLEEALSMAKGVVTPGA